MYNIIKKEILHEFYGRTNVIKRTFSNGKIVYQSQGRSFITEVLNCGATKLNTNKEGSKYWLYLFNDNNDTVGKYRMAEGLWHFTPKQLTEQHNRLFLYEELILPYKSWEPCIDGNLAITDSYKEGCGMATILKNGKYHVEDMHGNIVVPPGRYDYIDGFDHNLARVKIDGRAHLSDSSLSTKDRWGLIDTEGKEILPLIYSEIWVFYKKNRRFTTVYKGDMEDWGYNKRAIQYRFEFNSNKLVDVEKEMYERWMDSMSSQYSIWDAFEDDPEAAAAADFEW